MFNLFLWFKTKKCIKRPLNININVKKFDQQKLETTVCKSVNDHSWKVKQFGICHFWWVNYDLSKKCLYDDSNKNIKNIVKMWRNAGRNQS